MSIGIGLVTNHPELPSIVLVSDSRTENERGTKRHDLSKITVLECGSLKIGIVQAGKTDFSSAAVRNAVASMEVAKPQTEREVLNFICDACKEIHRHVVALNPGVPYRANEASFDLIVGIFASGVPKLYSISSFSCLAQPERNGQAYIGTGASIADYMLHGALIDNSEQIIVAHAAIYVATIASSRDPECEGPIQVAIVTGKEAVLLDSYPDSMAEITADCLAFDKKQKREWIEMVGSAVWGAAVDRYSPKKKSKKRAPDLERP